MDMVLFVWKVALTILLVACGYWVVTSAWKRQYLSLFQPSLCCLAIVLLWSSL